MSKEEFEKVQAIVAERVAREGLQDVVLSAEDAAAKRLADIASDEAVDRMIADAQEAGIRLLDGPDGLISQLTAKVIEQAWDELVEGYAPLIWSICRRYRLCRAYADDVGRSVWLKLVGQLASLRDPAALPGWPATTTQRECGRVLRAARKQEAPGHWLDAADIPD